MIGSIRVGYLRPEFVEKLSAWPDVFLIQENGAELGLPADTLSQKLDQVVKALHRQNVIADYLDEAYPITAESRDQVFGTLDRGAAVYFGIRTYGQHVNGYVCDRGQLKLWIARRAANRNHFPNRLDNFVAGGLPWPLSLAQNLQKESAEEAGVAIERVNCARAVGTVSYIHESPKGVKPETLYCYDLELPLDFEPTNTDDEVGDFMLMPVEEVMQIVAETDEFKPNCNLVIIDFLIRHGLIDPETEGYARMLKDLRQ